MGGWRQLICLAVPLLSAAAGATSRRKLVVQALAVWPHLITGGLLDRRLAG